MTAIDLEPPRSAKHLSPSGIFFYSLANIGIGAFYAFNNFVLPLWLQGYTSNAKILGLMGGTHSFEGALIQPVVGSISDRLSGKFGRRRPFLLLFVPICAFFLFLTPVVAHVPHEIRLAAIITSIVLFTTAFNIALDPYQALLADITSPDQRGRVTGLWYLAGAIGQISILAIIFLLKVRLSEVFLIVGAVMLTTTILTCSRTREEPAVPHSGPAVRRSAELREAFNGLRHLRQARAYLLMYLFYGLGVSAVIPFLTLFIEKITGCEDKTALGMAVILMLATAIGNAPCGWLSDRISAKRLLIVGIALIGIAAINGLWVNNLMEIALVLIVAGLGTAAQNASAFPLLTKLVPAREIGFFTGLQTTALSIAAPLSAIITGDLINHGGYRMIFAVCFVCILLSLFFLYRIRPNRAAAEIEARERETEAQFG